MSRGNEATEVVRSLPDGSVVVPQRLAGAIRRILVRDLGAHIRADGGAPTADVRELLYALGRAEHQAEQGTSANGTSPEATARVEISTDLAAQSLGCSAEYVRWLVRAGRLQGRRLGRAWLINTASLDAYRYGERKP